MWLALIVGLVAALFAAGLAYLTWYLRWETRQTSGMAYYGRPLPERRALKERIRRYSLPILPLVRGLAFGNRERASMPSFEFRGMHGPTRVSSPAVFERAQKYQPRPEDVFVVTQMRCGTTWMQQIVFETVQRGHGDLSDKGYGHLYAVSPWIDGVNSISMEAAPLVGQQPTRIIKSHLPTTLCPYAADAKYIYVTRHPVSCFASIVDYNRSLLGPLAPPVSTLVDWFCSDRMYWLPWPQHVSGWWNWAQRHHNVLFIHYEEMTRDFDRVRDQVAAFLGYDLAADERRAVSEKSSFRYMKEHEDLFEMAPPTMFSVAGGEYLKSGKESRHEDVTPEVRNRILEYCRHALKGSEYPAGRFYADLADR